MEADEPLNRKIPEMRFPRPTGAARRPARRGRRELLQKSWQPSSGDRLRVLFSEYLEPRLLCCRRRAMACDFEFRIPDTERRRLDTIQAALDLVDRLEDRMSVFRTGSDISRINRRAHQEPVVVGPDVFSLLQEAVSLSRETGQAFDPTSGAYSRCWGFLAREGRQPTDAEIQNLAGQVGPDRIDFDSEKRTVRLKGSKVELNLGGIGKGYALDRAAALMRAAGLGRAHLHAGFSSVYALGGGAGSGSGTGWPVGIRHPLRPGRDFAILHLADCGMGTSGLKEQGYVIDGWACGHIIDPRTGYPARGKALVSAIAPTAAQADALSTAFFVMELEEIRSFCERHADVGALVLDRSSEAADSIQMHAFGRVSDLLEVLN